MRNASCSQEPRTHARTPAGLDSLATASGRKSVAQIRCISKEAMWLANHAYNWLDTLHVASSLYNFAPFLAAFSFHLSIRPQENSPYGPINPPISCACALLACRSAYLAAIPCMITELRKVANASPQSISEVGSHPATSLYQFIHCERVGRPGV